MQIGAPTPVVARECRDNEMKRLRDKIPLTTLQPGETVIVPHWEVASIWNFAMKAYTRVEAFGHGQYIYGETTGWDIAEGFLEGRLGTLVPNPLQQLRSGWIQSNKRQGDLAVWTLWEV